MADMPATITLNGVDYVTDEAAAANTREAVEPLLAEIERLKERDVAWGEAHAAWTEGRKLRDATIADLRAQLATVTAERDAIREALQMMVDHDVDYARINNLGDPEKQHRIKISRDALARLPSGPVTAADVQRVRERQITALSGMCPDCGTGHTGACYPKADVQRAKESERLKDGNAKFWRDYDAAQRERIAANAEREGWTVGETILPAMTIPDDGRVDAGMKERDWFETPMSLISSPPVADGIPEWSGADGGRDGA